MARSLRLLLGMVLLAAVLPAPADAQQKLQRLSRAESRLQLAMPALTGARETYFYIGWNADFSKETTVGVLRAARANYPRALVFMQELATNYVWRDPEPIDLDKVKTWSKFLRERELTQLPEVSGLTVNYLAYTIRFTVENSDCLAFSVLGGVPGVKGEPGANAIFGYYCSDVGTKLSPDDMRAVLTGWKIVPTADR